MNPFTAFMQKHRITLLISSITAISLCLVISVSTITLAFTTPNQTTTNITPAPVNNSQTSQSLSNIVNSESSATATPDSNIIVPVSSKEDLPYFSNSLFIGNSLTVGYAAFAGLDTGTFYAREGLNVETIQKVKVINDDGSVNPEGKGTMTIIDALSKHQFDNIYIGFGTNELGWIYSDLFIQQYGTLIDQIKQAQPNATIYVESVPAVTTARSNSDTVFNNPKILQYNELILNMAKEKNVHYLNIFETFQDDTGGLPENLTTDGMHLTGPGCNQWRNYVQTHVVQK